MVHKQLLINEILQIGKRCQKTERRYALDCSATEEQEESNKQPFVENA